MAAALLEVAFVQAAQIIYLAAYQRDRAVFLKVRWRTASTRAISGRGLHNRGRVKPGLCLQRPSDSQVTRDTLTVRLTLPLAGRVEDFRLQASAPCRGQIG